MTLADPLLNLLANRPNLPAAEVRSALGVSPATLMRMVQAAGPAVLAMGRARRRTYARRRALRGSLKPLPVYQIDERGGYSQVADLDLTDPHGSRLIWPACPWPLDADMADGWFEGLPYFLQDLRPDGFLGRSFARANAAALALTEDPKSWSEEDALYAMSLYGADPVGDLLIGEAALRKWLAQLQDPLEPIDEDELPQHYAQMAERAMAHGLAGSSAAGEFPKFMATRRANDAVVKALVKFSGSDDSQGSRRWADLLVCEHLAAETLRAQLGIEAASTRVLQATGRAAGRTFLEALRFDRHGEQGRSAVCSWSAVNNAWFGLAGRPWPEGATLLRDRKLIEPGTGEAIGKLWHFGKLIANSDMHDGNLSFRPGWTRTRPVFELAPAYDMLPMLYAPVRGVELPARDFEPALPLPAERETWLAAAGAALVFWQTAAADERISEPFRGICAGNRTSVAAAMALAAPGQH